MRKVKWNNTGWGLVPVEKVAVPVKEDLNSLSGSIGTKKP
jgi:hypothetical protein